MNEIVNKVLLAGDKFIPEMHLKQPGFTYRACRPFSKTKKEFRNLNILDILKVLELMDVLKI